MNSQVCLLQRYPLPQLQDFLLLVAIDLERSTRWQHVKVRLLCLQLSALRIIEVIVALVLRCLIILLLREFLDLGHHLVVVALQLAQADK